MKPALLLAATLSVGLVLGACNKQPQKPLSQQTFIVKEQNEALKKAVRFAYQLNEHFSSGAKTNFFRACNTADGSPAVVVLGDATKVGLQTSVTISRYSEGFLIESGGNADVKHCDVLPDAYIKKTLSED